MHSISFNRQQLFRLPPSRGKVDRAPWRETDEGAGAASFNGQVPSSLNQPPHPALRATFPREGGRGSWS